MFSLRSRFVLDGLPCVDGLKQAARLQQHRLHNATSALLDPSVTAQECQSACCARHHNTSRAPAKPAACLVCPEALAPWAKSDVSCVWYGLARFVWLPLSGTAGFLLPRGQLAVFGMPRNISIRPPAFPSFFVQPGKHAFSGSKPGSPNCTRCEVWIVCVVMRSAFPLARPIFQHSWRCAVPSLRCWFVIVVLNADVRARNDIQARTPSVACLLALSVRWASPHLRSDGADFHVSSCVMSGRIKCVHQVPKRHVLQFVRQPILCRVPGNIRPFILPPSYRWGRTAGSVQFSDRPVGVSSLRTGNATNRGG